MQASEEEEEAAKERSRAGKRRKTIEEAAATTRATAERAERAEDVLLAARQAAERREAGDSDGDSEHDPLGMAAARVGQWRRPRRRQATAAGMGHVARHEYVIEVGRGNRGGGSTCDVGADLARRAAASRAAWQRESASAAAEKAEAETAVASAAAASGPGRQTAAAQRMATAQRTMASEGPQAEGTHSRRRVGDDAGRPKSDAPSDATERGGACRARSRACKTSRQIGRRQAATHSRWVRAELRKTSVTRRVRRAMRCSWTRWATRCGMQAGGGRKEDRRTKGWGGNWML